MLGPIIPLGRGNRLLGPGGEVPVGDTSSGTLAAALEPRLNVAPAELVVGARLNEMALAVSRFEGTLGSMRTDVEVFADSGGRRLLVNGVFAVADE